MQPTYTDKVKFCKDTKAVKQYAFIEEPNRKFRKEMEDSKC